ncbi:MAG: hypothetical protein A2X84_11810 [Desulfuromonadaceae bacterium GWC2_58_13]|nr:MAG: hypothetical protein A2X84_11810 [Desulfuromonadaceae bacterium GWC2_58_13]
MSGPLFPLPGFPRAEADVTHGVQAAFPKEAVQDPSVAGRCTVNDNHGLLPVDWANVKRALGTRGRGLDATVRAGGFPSRAII